MSSQTVYRTCNVCEAMCGLAMTVEEGRITGVRADKDDVFSRGHICPKGPAMREVLEDPDRVRVPLRRTGSSWKEISWDEALDETATRLRELRAKHGKDSVGIYLGNPNVHNHGAILGVQGFAKAVGTKNRFDANSQDANPKLFACMVMYGDQAAITIPDVDRTDYFLVLGANPAASMGSLMTLGDVRGRLAEVRERGGKIVLVDPRRTETAGWSDEHHFIRPGADAAFVLALLHVVFERGVNREAIAKQARGLEALEGYARAFSPERVAKAVGIPAETIRRIATDFASAKRAVAYGRVGTCTNEFGPTAIWLIEALNVVTGNFDSPGGLMFPSPAVDVANIGRAVIGNHYARWRSRVRGLPEFGGLLPAAVMAEEMETEGAGQIRGFVTLAGNPVLSTPNGERLAQALSKLEFMVSVDYYLNETTRHAHILLPPVHALERSHFDLVFHALAVRNTVKYSPRVVEPAPGAREDFSILYDLGMRLGGVRLGHPVLDRLARMAWKRGWSLTPDAIVDFALRIGPYGDRFLPKKNGLNLKKVKAAPHGIDLGPMVPSAKERVRTRDGLVDLAPAVFAPEMPRVERWLGERDEAELVLIGRRHLRTNNSWMHNVHSLVKGPDRSQLLMNREDAARMNLEAGQAVRVRSRVGVVTTNVLPTDDIMPGVVSLPHGYGHAAAASTMRIAGATAGANVNAITDDLLVEPILGTAILNGVPVTVEAVGAASSSASSSSSTSSSSSASSSSSVSSS